MSGSFLFKARDMQAGGVAAGHHVTADAAACVLDKGGDAFSAAIAAFVASCFAEPMFSSPGGGGFLTGLIEGRKPINLDFFVNLPGINNPDAIIERFTAHFGEASQDFLIGAGTAAVPGMAAGILQIWKLSNQLLTFENLFEIGITAARKLQISKFQAHLLSILESVQTATEEASQLFTFDGELLTEGADFSNPELEAFLSQFAEDGLARLDTGGFAHSEIIKQQQRLGGHLRIEDFCDYQTEERAPVSLEIKYNTILGNGFPALGGALSLAMFSELSKGPFLANDILSVIKKIDADWRQSPDILHFPNKYGLLVDEVPKSGEFQSFRGTTHMSIIDRHKNAVSLTVTNGEGNGQIVPKTGFMMNNMLGEDDVNPCGPLGWLEKPITRRRLASMMNPTIAIMQDQAIIALGSGGSNRIRTAIFQVLANRILCGMSLEEAVRHPRVHFEKTNTDIEDAHAIDSRVFNEMDENTVLWNGLNFYFGGVHAVERKANGRIVGAGDERREGVFVSVD